MSISELTDRFKFYAEWEEGTRKPTINQLQQLSKKVSVPFGYLFLSEPPEEESIPIADFRTKQNDEVSSPSPELLDTIYAMQRRQDWMSDYLQEKGVGPLSFVDTISTESEPVTAAVSIRQKLEFKEDWASEFPSWEDALRELRRSCEEIGITVVRNGVVGNNTSRPLDVNEFRGFVLSDSFAPLIFINGKDAKAAQMFTLAHELVHIWMGSDGLFDLEEMKPSSNEIEQYCNDVAAEFLVPKRLISSKWDRAGSRGSPFKSLASDFKVSPIVVARRALDLDLIPEKEFFDFYDEYVEERKSKSSGSGGGDFYNLQNLRLGTQFADTVFTAVQEGNLLYRRAYRLTGLKAKTFSEYAKRRGFDV